MRMVAAGIWALGVHRAQAGLAIQVEAIAVGQARQRENTAFLIEVLDDAGFAEALGNVFCGFVTLEGIHHFKAYQVIDPHFDR